MIKLKVPFYLQSTAFTCDPACLMMALKYFYPRCVLSRSLEFEIWREAYGIGISGCMPQGLAYSALKRGLNATLICKKKRIIQISEKLATGYNREIALFTSKRLLKEARKRGMRIIDTSPDMKDIEKALAADSIPIVMINMRLLHNLNSPHWVIVIGLDERLVWINDPYDRKGKGLSIAKENFLEMMNDLNKYTQIDKRILLVSKA